MSDFGSAKESISPSESSEICNCVVCGNQTNAPGPCFLEAEINCDLGDICLFTGSAQNLIYCAKKPTLLLGHAVSPPMIGGMHQNVPPMTLDCEWGAEGYFKCYNDRPWLSEYTYGAIGYRVWLLGREFDQGGGLPLLKQYMKVARVYTFYYQNEVGFSDPGMVENHTGIEGFDYFLLDAWFWTDLIDETFDCEIDMLGAIPPAPKRWNIDNVEYGEPEICPNMTFTITGAIMGTDISCDPCDESSV